MGDNRGRSDRPVREEEGRQSERAVTASRDHAREDKPMHEDPGERLGELDSALETREYPVTTDELIEAFGGYEVEVQRGHKSVEDILSRTDNERYISASDVRSRIQGLIHR